MDRRISDDDALGEPPDQPSEEPRDEPGAQPDELVVAIRSDTALTYATFHAVQQQYAAWAAQADYLPVVHLWLHSPGGDAHAAYKLGRYLQGRSVKLLVAVPEYAKSAATLLALAGDVIYMDLAGELGPLDAQVMHEGPTSVERRSALDYVTSFDHLAFKAMAAAGAAGAQMLGITGLSRSEVLAPCLKFGSDLVTPLIEKLDPREILSVTALLEVAERYSVELLRHRHEPAAEEAFQAVSRLVSDFPTHGYVIDLDAAVELGLSARSFNDYPQAHVARAFHQFTYGDEFAIVSPLNSVLDNVAPAALAEASAAAHADDEHSAGQASTEEGEAADDGGRVP